MMKSPRHYIIMLFLFGTIVSKAQQINDQILLTVGNDKISSTEFSRTYLKNHLANSKIDSKSVEDYLKLYIDFRLKVLDAKDSQLDTLASFRNELSGYRQQLAAPYLTDKETEQRLLKEAYERMKYEVSASHILISVSEQATSEDTLKLFDKAISIRNRIINGESFEVVARSTSDDPSVANNNGFLGYFTVFQMVYPFESAAYKLKIGEVSMPVRTRFGYHILKVNDKRPAKGQVKVAHIMIALSKEANEEQKSKAKERIDEIYKQVLNNEDFGQLANKNSEDPGSAQNNGELPWFGSNSVIPEFENVSFGFEHDGQISEPFQSSFGWHIVKRLGRKEIGSYEEMLPEIKKRLSSDMRNLISIDKMIDKIKLENNFKEDTINLSPIELSLDSTIYKGEWKIPDLKANKNLFSLTGMKYNQSDFLVYLELYQKNGLSGSFHSIVRKVYNDWVNSIIYNYQQSILEQKYPDFKNLMQEYYDGILLFNISDLKVWSKASSDSLGIMKFYQINKENYKWGERIHFVVYSSKDEKVIGKIAKQVQNIKGKDIKPEDIANKFNKTQNVVTLEYFITNPDEKEIAEYKSWKDNLSPIISKEGKFCFKQVISVTMGEIKSLKDCRGQVISDYQQFLEEEWLKSLHQKYSVEVNKDVLNQLIGSLEKQ